LPRISKDWYALPDDPIGVAVQFSFPSVADIGHSVGRKIVEGGHDVGGTLLKGKVDGGRAVPWGMGRGRWQSPKRRQVTCQFTYLLSFLVLCHTTSSATVLKLFLRKHAPDPNCYLSASAPTPTSSNSSLTVQNTQILPQKTRPRSRLLSLSVRAGTRVFQLFPDRAKYSNSSENTPPILTAISQRPRRYPPLPTLP